MHKVDKFKIDRGEWYRGKGSRGSALLLKDGMRCCLGIFGRAIGVPDKCMLGVGAPDSSHETIKAYQDSEQTKWLFMKDYDSTFMKDYERSKDCVDLMYANDAPSLSEEEREEDIIRIFAKNGIEVSFKG